MGYFNATALCKPFGKVPDKFIRTKYIMNWLRDHNLEVEVRSVKGSNRGNTFLPIGLKDPMNDWLTGMNGHAIKKKYFTPGHEYSPGTLGIYLIKCQYEDLEFFKIGFTHNIKQRLRYLNTHNCFPCSLVEFVVRDDSKELERFILGSVRGQKINGEWFKLTSSQVSKVRRMINGYR